jgi:hypothetical protein
MGFLTFSEIVELDRENGFDVFGLNGHNGPSSGELHLSLSSFERFVY